MECKNTSLTETDTRRELKDLLEQTGMTVREAADVLGIPFRTFQNWTLGYRRCPDYMVQMIKSQLWEKKIIHSEDDVT